MGMVFYGAGYFGKIAWEHYTKKKYADRLIGFMDGKKTGQYCGVPIVSWNDIDVAKTAVVITVQNPYVVSQIYRELQNYKVQHIFWFINLNWTETSNSFLSSECIEGSNWGACPMPQAEIHVADYCNLNCRGCTHFSPIFEREIPEFDVRINDIMLLKKKFSSIVHFSILGGEPLLNPDIVRYIKETRKLLPNTYLQIVTNGLLIPRLSEDVFVCIKENRVVVSISEYEPTHRQIEQIRDKLNQYQIPYCIRSYDSKQKFNKPLSLSEKSKYPNICISNGCVNVWNGKIARCPTLMYVQKFNKVFAKNLPTEGILDLRDCPSGEELLEILQQQVPLCKHCILCEIEWKSCGAIPTWKDFAEKD